jgi:hypothetical protein
MPLGELGEPVIRIAYEFVVQALLKGAGHLVVKYGLYLGRREPDPNGSAVVVAGLLFWVFVFFGGYHVYMIFAESLSVGAA